MIDVERARASLHLMEHRGPDGWGEWMTQGVYVGHRRLSILDLSDSGKQPMESDECVVSVNGEIYNYKSLRRELSEQVEFRSESDSEVVLHGYSVWGIDGLLSRLEGMFAFSIYDKRKGQLFLVRDRVGIKPLYYSTQAQGIAWSSELKSLSHYFQMGENDFSPESLLDFVTYRYIPAPKTLYRNVFKLLPAHYLKFDLRGCQTRLVSYWDVQPEERKITLPDALDELEKRLGKSVSEQLVSDVPLGALLSGGIDSGSVVAQVTKQGKSLKTYSIGFANSNYDESELIESVAEHLGIENDLNMLSEEFTHSHFKVAAGWFDEPFADFSMLPTFAVCEHARRHVTVALSGDGADELFAGYDRFLSASIVSSDPGQLSNLLGKVKQKLGWTFFGRLVRELEYRQLNGWDWYCVSNGGILPNESGLARKALGVSSDYDVYWLYKKFWRKDVPAMTAMRYLEFKTSLPDAMLTKVDRVSMQNALEVRVPYLATDIIDFAFSVPETFLLQNGTPKFLLRELANNYLPETVTSAPKKGFGLPPGLRLDSKGRRCSAQHKTLAEIFNMQALARTLC